MGIILAYANIVARDLIAERLRVIDGITTIIPVSHISDIPSALHQCEDLRLILLDTGLPDVNGLTGLMHVIKLAKHKPSVAVAVMGAPTSKSEYAEVFATGAMGYIPKNISAKSLFSAITLLLEGQKFVPADDTHHRDEETSTATPHSFLPLSALTRRECDVLRSLLLGDSDKEIAKKYRIALVTVKHHLKSLRVKLGAKNRTHAVCRAFQLGLRQQILDLAKGK